MGIKRIIPCLDVKVGRVVKGIKFGDLRDAGDPVDMAVEYEAQGADELVFLDITATIEGRKTMVHLVKQVADNISIPFTVGGGSEILMISAFLKAGADKVSLGTAAVKNSELVTDAAREFGRGCIVVAMMPAGLQREIGRLLPMAVLKGLSGCCHLGSGDGKRGRRRSF